MGNTLKQLLPILIPKVYFEERDALTVREMKALNYHAVEKYCLPTKLMMENAGFQLARLVASKSEKEHNIVIGIGQDNNGIAGLVAARRLAAWGYKVTLNMPKLSLSKSGHKQIERTKALGVLLDIQEDVMPDVFVDAWFGMNQTLPLTKPFLTKLLYFNQLPCKKISLDIPTGLVEAEDKSRKHDKHPHVHADFVLALGAPKKIIFNPQLTAQIFVADLGIPRQAYIDLGLFFDLPFDEGGLVQLLM